MIYDFDMTQNWCRASQQVSTFKMTDMGTWRIHTVRKLPWSWEKLATQINTHQGAQRIRIFQPFKRHGKNSPASSHIISLLPDLRKLNLSKARKNVLRMQHAAIFRWELHQTESLCPERFYWLALQKPDLLDQSLSNSCVGNEFETLQKNNS